jgi:hypothetical protein
MMIKPHLKPLLAVAALALAGLAATAPAAQAAARTPATPATSATPAPALHGRTIALGATSDLYGNAFTAAPNGSVFFSRGTVIYVVEGNKAPALALHAAGAVLALAANNTDLFVETGLRVSEYSRSTGRQVGRWTLSSPVAGVTSAGLYLVGGTLWTWTDWATDESGFEYAQVSRIHIAGSLVHVIDKAAFPGDMSADAAGLYYENVRGVNSYLAHANPTNSAVQLHKTSVDAPLALAGGRVDALSFGATSEDVISYNASTLKQISAKKVPSSDVVVAGTGLGLLVLADGCNAFPCSSATVGVLNTGTGGTSRALRTPGAFQFLTGPVAAVIEASDVHGTHANLFLVRISS